jgi:hypothetical protein
MALENGRVREEHLEHGVHLQVEGATMPTELFLNYDGARSESGTYIAEVASTTSLLGSNGGLDEQVVYWRCASAHPIVLAVDAKWRKFRERHGEELVPHLLTMGS